MTISEPTTVLTDYVLGILTACLARQLWRESQMRRHTTVAWWSAALGATAVASFAGGTYHGFAPAMGWRGPLLWKLTTLAVGSASFFLLAAAIWAAAGGATRSLLLAAATAKLVLYWWWMLHHDEFVFVILDYGSTLLVVGGLTLMNGLRGSGHRRFLAGGIALSVIAAGVQQSRFQLHKHFNHNDLMHVIQMGAVWLLYEGGRRLHDARGEG